MTAATTAHDVLNALIPSRAGEVRLALHLGAELGEGLHWDARRSCLYAVDIHGRRLWRWTLDAGGAESWLLPQRLGWVVPCTTGDDLLLGLQTGIFRARLDGPTLALGEPLVRPFADGSPLRLNDAKADPTGALWTGSLNNDDESRPEGRFFRLGPQGDWQIKDSGYCVTNGPALHPGGRWMLHSDSARRTIYAFDVQLATGQLSAKRVWKVLTPQEGYPDGMCFDTEGCLWLAHWGAGCVSRYSAAGRLLQRWDLPATNVTNVCFAGPALDRVFVTTARAGLSEAQRAAEPLAGALFEIVSPGAVGRAGCTWGAAA